jgi:hypothetical protein
MKSTLGDDYRMLTFQRGEGRVHGQERHGKAPHVHTLRKKMISLCARSVTWNDDGKERAQVEDKKNVANLHG